jgi:hypothetical protein
MFLTVVCLTKSGQTGRIENAAKLCIIKQKGCFQWKQPLQSFLFVFISTQKQLPH